MLYFLIILLALTNSLTGFLHSNKLPCGKCQQLLKITDPILKNWFEKEQSLDNTLHIMTAYRGQREQDVALKNKASKVGWGKSAHNYLPTFAIDLFFLVDGKPTQNIQKYKKLTSRLPDHIGNGSSFPGLVDWGHFYVKNWQSLAKNYPNGQILTPRLMKLN